MPELPEITCRAREMSKYLTGLVIESVDVLQPKCLNIPVARFRKALVGAELGETTARGKWLICTTTKGYLLINLGMGGELLLVGADALPEKWRVRFGLSDGRQLAVNFWWFGSTHFAPPNGLGDHPQLARLGPNASDITPEEFRARLEGRRSRIKSFLLDQSNVAGIGNAYVHDILFRARLHPARAIPTLSEKDIQLLYRAIQAELGRSIELGGASYELGLMGQRGQFGAEHLLVGYREGEHCPECGAVIEKLKTGSTTSYVCPQCQPLRVETSNGRFEAVSHKT